MISASKQWLILGATALSLASCGGAATQAGRASHSDMDKPAYHNLTGERQLREGDYDAAKVSFKKAKELDPKNPGALAGMAVAMAHQTNRPEVSEETKDKVFKEGKTLLEEAVKNATIPADEANAHAGAVRFHVILERPQGKWRNEAESHFEKAVELAPEEPSAYFYMASAEATSLRYDEAKVLYNKVIKLDGAYSDEASAEVERIQKVELALPSSQFGKEVANNPKISRADAAALFLAELRLDRLFMDQQKQYSAAFAPPETQRAFKRSPAQTLPDATDLTNHPLADSIELVIKLGIRGLQPDAEHKFSPSEPLTRSELAVILEDLLVKVTKDDALATQFVGQDSPHPDVPNDRYYFNAVRTSVNRGLMKPADAASGAFNPMGEVSGADALLAIRNLKKLLPR